MDEVEVDVNVRREDEEVVEDDYVNTQKSEQRAHKNIENDNGINMNRK